MSKKFLFLALAAFAALGTELAVLLGLTHVVFNRPISWTDYPFMITHWSVTIVVWAVSAMAILRISEAQMGFDVRERRADVTPLQWAGVAMCFGVLLTQSFLAWGGFKPLIEFRNLGSLLFTFQYVYYGVETLLFLLIIVLGQKAGEIRFGLTKIPYGGLLVAATWGLVHWLTQGSLMAGVYSAFAGLVYGVAFLLLNRDFNKAWPILFLMFAV